MISQTAPRPNPTPTHHTGTPIPTHPPAVLQAAPGQPAAQLREARRHRDGLPLVGIVGAPDASCASAEHLLSRCLPPYPLCSNVLPRSHANPCQLVSLLPCLANPHHHCCAATSRRAAPPHSRAPPASRCSARWRPALLGGGTHNARNQQPSAATQQLLFALESCPGMQALARCPRCAAAAPTISCRCSRKLPWVRSMPARFGCALNSTEQEICCSCIPRPAGTTTSRRRPTRRLWCTACAPSSRGPRGCESSPRRAAP